MDEQVRMLLNPGMVVVLTNHELAALRDQYGVVLPPTPLPIVGDPALGADLLGDRGMVTDGGLTDLGRDTVRALFDTAKVVVVERQLPGDRRSVWTFLIGELGFSEQVQTDGACVWGLGGHGQLLGRVLLAAGVLRDAHTEGPVLDPIDEPSFDLIVSSFGPGGTSSTLVASRHDAGWSVPGADGPNVRAAVDLVDEIGSLVAGRPVGSAG